MRHAAEFRRCLVELDGPAILRLWRHVSPHLAQPKSDDEVLETMHRARVAMTTLPEKLRIYSEEWLKERAIQRIETVVGIAVIAPEKRRVQAEQIHAAMTDAVEQAVVAGLDLDKDAAEVSRRMNIARDKA